MAQEDPELRARITGLDDRELARMLTADADNYRDEALAIAREEVQRRGLDLAVAASASEWGSHPAPPVRKPYSLRFTQPLPERDLPGFGIAAFLCVLSLTIEILAWTLSGPSPELRRYSLIGVFVVGTLEYLRIVHRLHSALQVAAEGNYPVAPAFSVVAHFIPFYNAYWLYRWPTCVADCAAVNGRNRSIDWAVPAVLFGLGVVAGFFYVTPRLVFFFAATWYTQHALLQALRDPPRASAVAP